MADWIVLSVAYNYDSLPDNVKNLLFNLAQEEETAVKVANKVASNYNNLPENVRNLLFKLAEDKEKAWCAADATFQHFDRLPENVRNKLLILLATNENAARIVALTVWEKFDMLQEVRNELLLKLTSQELLLKLANGNERFSTMFFRELVSYVTKTIHEHYAELPDNVRELIDSLANFEKASPIVKSYFHMLSSETVNEFEEGETTDEDNSI